MTEKMRTDPEVIKLCATIVEKLEKELNMSKPRALKAFEIVANDLLPFTRDLVLKEIKKE